MPKASPSISAFTSGELSRLLDGQTGEGFYGIYSTGCRRLENFLSTVSGPAMRRGGTKFVKEIKNSAHRCWLVPFSFSRSQSFMLEFGDQYIRFYTNRAQLLNAGVPYEVATPYAIADLTAADGTLALSYVQSGDVIYLTCPGYAPRKLSRLGNTNWTLSIYEPKNGPFLTQNIDKTITVTGVTYNANITGAANNGSGLIRLTVGSTTGLVTGAKVRVALVTGTTEANGYWTVTVVSSTTIDLQGSTFTNAYVSGGEIRVRGDVGNTITLTASSGIFETGHVGSLFYLELSDFSATPPWEVGKPANFTERRRSDGKTYEVQIGGETGSVRPIHTEGSEYDGFDDTDTSGVTEGVLWRFNDSGAGIVKITSRTSGTEVIGEIMQAMPYEFTINSKPSYRWAHGAWSVKEGWPEHVAFFRERLVFSKGFKIYFSVAGDFENMAAKEFGEVLADSAIIAQALSDQANQINWLFPADKGLIVGTEGGEFIVAEISSGEPFGPENIEVKPQTRRGSRGITPVGVGDSILFVQRSGRKLFEVSYSITSEKNQTRDMTAFAQHITRSGVVDMCYQQDPHSLVWAARADGLLIAFTFQSEQRVTAWHRHPIGGNGIVEAVACIPSPDGSRDDLWMIVRRTISGQTKRYIEYMAPEFEEGDEIEDAFYVDSGLTYSGAVATTITGLGHLEGKVVDILGDGAVLPSKTVTSGSITLDYAVSKAHIGLPFTSVLQPMRIEAGAGDGTAQGKTKRINKMNIRFDNTVGGKAGPRDDLLDEIQFRTIADAMDQPIPAFTGDKLMEWPDGYSTDGFIIVKQEQPLPMTIVALHPQLHTQDR